MCEQRTQSRYPAAHGRKSNPQPLDCKSDVLTITPPSYMYLCILSCHRSYLSWCFALLLVVWKSKYHSSSAPRVVKISRQSIQWIPQYCMQISHAQSDLLGHRQSANRRAYLFVFVSCLFMFLLLVFCHTMANIDVYEQFFCRCRYIQSTCFLSFSGENYILENPQLTSVWQYDTDF